MKNFTFLLSFAALIIFSDSLSAQTVLFEENFDDGSAADRWSVTTNDGTNNLDFAFDYITSGIEAAPNGGGNCLKLESNTDEANTTPSIIVVTPTDETFSGNYIISFDMWMNYGTSGTTEYSYFGVKNLTDQTGAQFKITGDNGATNDFNAFVDGSLISTDEAGVYYNSSRNGLDYNAFYDGADPAFEWLEVVLEVSASTVVFKLNGNVAITAPATTVNGNLVLGYEDLFSSYGGVDAYILFDNIKVIEDVSTGIKTKQLETFTMYPNPANEILNIVVENRSKFELLNSIGQVIISKVIEGGNNVIELGNLKGGFYIAKVTNEAGQSQTRKVLVKK